MDDKTVFLRKAFSENFILNWYLENLHISLRQSFKANINVEIARFKVSLLKHKK